MERKIIKKETLSKGRVANRKESVNRKVSSIDKTKTSSTNKNHFNSNLSHKKIFLKNHFLDIPSHSIFRKNYSHLLLFCLP